MMKVEVMSMTRLVKHFGDDYILVQDSQEIKAILDYIGVKKISPRPRSLFVKIDNGDYVEVWGLNHYIPWSVLEAYRLK